MSICAHAGARDQNSQIFKFFNSGYAHDGNILIFRRRASRVTANTLIKSNYASVRQSRDMLHRDTHNGPEKSRKSRMLWNRWSKEAQKLHEYVFVAHYYAWKFGVNRLRIDRDIRQKPL